MSSNAANRDAEARSILTDILAEWGDPEFFGRLGNVGFTPAEAWVSTRQLAAETQHPVNSQNLGRFVRGPEKVIGYSGIICADCCSDCPDPGMAAALLAAPVVTSVRHAEIILRKGSMGIWCDVCEIMITDLDVRG